MTSSATGLSSTFAAPHAPRSLWRQERVHFFLLLGVLCASLNAFNVLLLHIQVDAVTYAMGALVLAFAAATQTVSQPLGVAQPLNLRWKLWTAFLLVKATAFAWSFSDAAGLTHITFNRNLVLFACGYGLCYLALVRQPADSPAKLHWTIDIAIALTLAALVFTVEVHTDGPRLAGRFLFGGVLQLVFAGAAFLSWMSSSNAAEARLSARMGVYFLATFCTQCLCNGSAIHPGLPWGAFANAFFPLSALAVLAFSAFQMARPQPPVQLVPSRLPSASPILLTAALILTCVPLLHWHLEAGIILAVTAITLFAVRVAILQSHLTLERASLEHGGHNLLKLATTDSLTGIANRRCFLKALDEAIARAHAEHSFFSLAVFDIDNLKHINDNQGHLAGDECLKEFARTVNATVAPPFPHFARLGGDEFTLLLHHVAEADLRSLVDEVRAALAHTQARFSAGTASFSADDPRSATELLADADAHLYRSKKRNEKRLSLISR